MSEAFQQSLTQSQDPLSRAQNLLDQTIAEVEAILGETICSTVNLIPEVSRHLIASGGKRIRPILLLLIEQASRGRADRGVSLAVATELFHSATLLHDDVVDHGQLRRGVASARVVYGNSASVLVGDFLLAKAFNLVVQHGDLVLLKELSQVLSAMAEGEVLQLVRSGRVAVSMPDYVRIISGKTAGLFSWCCLAGASLDGSTDIFQTAAAAFGESFGMAFQIIDDVLDYTASPEKSGKDLANDLVQSKVTLPLLLACEQDDALLPLVEDATVAGPSEEQCLAIVRRVLATNAIQRARQEAENYIALAHRHLESFPKSPALRCLEEITRFVVDRVA